MVKSIYKENKEKIILKRRGHSLIDKIKWRGYSKASVYIMLAKEMDRDEPQVHFSAMHRLGELRDAVAALERLDGRLPKTQFASPTKKKTVMIAPVKIIRANEQPKIVGEVKSKKNKHTSYSKKRADMLDHDKYLQAMKELKEAKQELSLESKDNFFHRVWNAIF